MQELDFSNVKRVLLVGAGGKTGFWYARLLISRGIDVYAYDQNESVTYSEELMDDKHFHRIQSSEFNDASILDKVDSVTLSPGVPLRQNIFLKAQEKGKFIFSELEYCYDKLSDRHWICVTGTDGKSTTVALIEHGLKTFGKNAISCGNYGLSFSRIAYEYNEYSKYEILVAELSSYQLELCRNLKSDVSIYLNLAPDHLNRYKDLEEYGLVKYNIAGALKYNGLFIVNKNLLPRQTQFWQQNHPIDKLPNTVNIIYIDTHTLDSENFQIVDRNINDRKNNQKILMLNELNIHGEHNFTNVLFTLEAMRYYGCVEHCTIKDALTSFMSLPHRYEKIDLPDDVHKNIYINDSKATTTQAAGIAIKNSKTPLFIFMGGRSKGEDYTEIGNTIRNKQAFVFLYGENQNEINDVFSKLQVQIISLQENLESAFHEAIKFQDENRLKEVTYLLSPASTSWDQYSSFEERGDHFRSLVNSLKNFL